MSGPLSWVGIHAVVFDAVGTLVVPDPPAVEVYRRCGERYGLRLGEPAVGDRFRRAFAAEEDVDRRAGWRTDAAREERRWRAVVATVLEGVADAEACFRDLWDHFAQPGAWRLGPAIDLFRATQGRPLKVAVASNFDARLRTVLAGLPDLARVETVVVSAEVGWRKPARAFYGAVVRAVGCEPGTVVYVGDDGVNDCEAAESAGLRSWLV